MGVPVIPVTSKTRAELIPLREALGLTMNQIDCDRTAHRYRVTDDSAVLPWTAVARSMPREQREDLELAPGARPRHWYVATVSVQVTYDPVSVAA